MRTLPPGYLGRYTRYGRYNGDDAVTLQKQAAAEQLRLARAAGVQKFISHPLPPSPLTAANPPPISASTLASILNAPPPPSPLTATNPPSAATIPASTWAAILGGAPATGSDAGLAPLSAAPISASTLASILNGPSAGSTTGTGTIAAPAANVMPSYKSFMASPPPSPLTATNLMAPLAPAPIYMPPEQIDVPVMERRMPVMTLPPAAMAPPSADSVFVGPVSEKLPPAPLVVSIRSVPSPFSPPIPNPRVAPFNPPIVMGSDPDAVDINPVRVKGLCVRPEVGGSPTPPTLLPNVDQSMKIPPQPDFTLGPSGIAPASGPTLTRYGAEAAQQGGSMLPLLLVGVAAWFFLSSK